MPGECAAPGSGDGDGNGASGHRVGFPGKIAAGRPACPVQSSARRPSLPGSKGVLQRIQAFA